MEKQLRSTIAEIDGTLFRIEKLSKLGFQLDDVFRMMLYFSRNISINALWDLAFQSLGSDSRAVLGVLCFVSPDDVPQALFERESASNLPESLQFCSDPDR